MFVSVVMPMRNAQAYVREAVYSILGQAPANLELLVIDDGSTDDSRQIVLSVGDARVRLLDGPRSGIAACLNLGFAHARGDVLMRCDADDVFAQGRIDRQLAWLSAHADHVAVCGAFCMVDRQGVSVAAPLSAWQSEVVEAADSIRAGQLRTHLCAFAFRRSGWAAGPGFRSFFETAEDIDFTLRLAQAGRIGYLPAVEYIYRLHGDSITHTQVSSRREFFEATAYTFAREREATGQDALMRGAPPRPPTATGNGAGAHATSAHSHVAQMLVGQAWQEWTSGHRPAARRTAWRAVQASPWQWQPWRTLALVALKPSPPG